jgi:hypothetical protein
LLNAISPEQVRPVAEARATSFGVVKHDQEGDPVTIITISLLKNGDCRLVQCSASGDVSAPLWLRRSELENYFRGTVLVAGTLEQALKDLDRVGIVEFTTF